MTSYPSLGFHPAPGDLGAIDAAISAGRTIAKGLHPAEKTFRPAESEKWGGDASNTFGVVVSAVATRLHQATRRQETLGHGLTRWRRQLSDFQEQARHLEHQASAAKKERDRAWKWAPTNVAEAQKMAAAEAELRRIRGLAHDLLDDHRRAAHTIARSIAA